MFHGVIQKITVAQFFETRCSPTETYMSTSQTDGRTTYDSNTVLALRASRGKHTTHLGLIMLETMAELHDTSVLLGSVRFLNTTCNFGISRRHVEKICLVFVLCWQWMILRFRVVSYQ